MSIDRDRFPDAALHVDLEREFMEDPAYRAEDELLRPRYELISAVIGARKARGLTQAALAQACGTSQSAIARLESGDHDPRWSTAVKVCRVLEIPISIAGTEVA